MFLMHKVYKTIVSENKSDDGSRVWPADPLANIRANKSQDLPLVAACRTADKLLPLDVCRWAKPVTQTNTTPALVHLVRDALTSTGWRCPELATGTGLGLTEGCLFLLLSSR